MGHKTCFFKAGYVPLRRPAFKEKNEKERLPISKLSKRFVFLSSASQVPPAEISYVNLGILDMAGC